MGEISYKNYYMYIMYLTERKWLKNLFQPVMTLKDDDTKNLYLLILQNYLFIEHLKY